MNALTRFGVAAAIALTGSVRASVADEQTAPRTYSPIERMTTARLKAAHEDVIKLREARRELPPLPGLHDFRTIFHAHAEDSAHTGGTRPEMLADAKRAGVSAIFLGNHYRPPKDFIDDSWRGLREGVLFVPGSEIRGFLIHPMHSIMKHMDDPEPAFLAAVRAEGGLAFLSHIEERPDHSTADLDGLEIYNRHADAKKDKAGILNLVLKLTDPKSLEELKENLRLYPDELFASQLSYPDDYLAKFDHDTAQRRLTGVAANDCHHNQILIVKMIDADNVRVGTNVDSDEQMRAVSARLRPGIRALTQGHAAGDVLARVDLDPYHRSFLNVSTHLLAPTLDEASLRDALRGGRAYVSHDWMAEPTGFRFGLENASGKSLALMGDEAKWTEGCRFVVESPVACRVRLLSGGKTIASGEGPRWETPATMPGVYRVEAWLSIGGEERPWVYTNPIYVRGK